jgi:hypothetical protein
MAVVAGPHSANLQKKGRCIKWRGCTIASYGHTPLIGINAALPVV